MSGRTSASRTHLWLESLGEWTWPRQSAAEALPLPPAWGPAFADWQPGSASTAGDSPVISRRQGQIVHAPAFLEIGIQSSRARLIAHKSIPPMIAVMIQDRTSLENWRDLGSRRSASYVAE